MLGINEKVFSCPPKTQILTFVLQNCKKSAVKHFMEKSLLLNFVDLFTLFRPRLQIHGYFNIFDDKVALIVFQSLPRVNDELRAHLYETQSELKPVLDFTLG